MYYPINSLIRDIGNVKTAFFIGAGAARCHLMPEHQLPDGHEMKLGLLRSYYGKKAKNLESLFEKDFGISAKSSMPELVWEKCLSSKREDLPFYHNVIQELFVKNKSIPPNYKFIAWLNLMEKRVIHDVITTNFDEKIEDAYRLLQHRGLFTGNSFLTAAYNEDYSHAISNDKETRIIYKLHGTISKPNSIISSFSEMEKSLHDDKFKSLKKIFSENSLVVFLGFAGNDDNIYKALEAVSKEVKGTKVFWVKRHEISPGDNIHKILKLFNNNEPSDNVVLSQSYEFLLELFTSNVNREEINLPFIKGQSQTIIQKLSDSTEIFLLDENDDQIPDILYKKIKYSQLINDDIFKIINSFDLQRLRDIKQLSSAHYKYPTATHSRFTHSLGVAFLVSRALENEYMKKVVSNEDKKNTIYAALLHDIGHGPLGHVLDKFFDRIGQNNEHENFTEKFIDDGLYDLDEVLSNVDMNRQHIKKRIMFDSRKKDIKKKEAEKAYLSLLITDYALDLDRIDFLMRDLIFTQEIPEISIPQFIQQEIFFNAKRPYSIETLKAIVDDYISRLNIATYDKLDISLKKEFPEGTNLLYIETKSSKFDTFQLIDFLLDLYCHMYLKVYYSEKVSCAEAMMAKALHIAYEIGDIDRSSLYKFTDSELLTYLENLDHDFIREILYAVKYRRFLKSVAEFNLDSLEKLTTVKIEDETNREKLTAVKIEDEIKREFNLDKYSFESLVIVHIPRKKKLRNLFVMQEGRIISYPNLEIFNEKLKNIKGYVFVNPSLELYSNDGEKERLIQLLRKIGLDPSITSKERIMNSDSQKTFDKF